MAKEPARKPRKLPKQARSRATYNAIVMAAARVLVEQGYDRATTNRIAEVAGVGIGSLYEFFPGKDAIFTEVRRQLNDEMLSVVEEAIAEAMEYSLEDGIRYAVATLVRAHAINPKLEKALKESVPERVLAKQNRQIEERLGSLAATFLSKHQNQTKNQALSTFIVLHTANTLSLEGVLRFPNKENRAPLVDEISILITRYIAS